MACQIAHRTVGVLAVFRRKPHIGRDMVAPVAGVAGHAGLGHVGLPVLIDALRHLNHAPGHHFGVFSVVRKVFGVMAIRTTDIRGHPLGDGRHMAVELRDAHIA